MEHRPDRPRPASSSIVRISSFGQDGPYSPRPGLDRVGIGYGGLLHLTGYPDRPPVRVGVTISDYLTGVFAAQAAIGALYARDVRALGQGRGDRRRALRRGAAHPRVDAPRVRHSSAIVRVARGQPARELGAARQLPDRRRQVRVHRRRERRQLLAPVQGDGPHRSRSTTRASPGSPTAPRTTTRSTGSSPSGRLARPRPRSRSAASPPTSPSPPRTPRPTSSPTRTWPPAATSSPSTTRSSGRCASRRPYPRRVGEPVDGSRPARPASASTPTPSSRELARPRRPTSIAAPAARKEWCEHRPRRPLPDGLFRERHRRHDRAGRRVLAVERPHPLPLAVAVPRTRAPTTSRRSSCPTEGTLWGWTAVTAPPPGYDGELPFGFGVVELTDGLRVITRLTESDPRASRSAADAPRARRAPDRRRRHDGHHVRVRPTVSDVMSRRRRSPASGSTRSAASTASPVTDMGVAAVQRRARRSREPALRGRVLRDRVLAASRPVTRCSARSVSPACRSSTSRPAARAAARRSMLAAGAIANGQYDTVLVFGMEKMPKGIIRSSFFEPWREQGGLAVDARVLRAPRAAADARVGRHQGAPGPRRREEPRQRRRQPERDVPEAHHGRRRARVAAGVRAAAPPHAVLAERRCRRGRRSAARAARCTPGRAVVAAAALRSHLPGSVLGEATPMSGIDDVDDHAAEHARGRGRVRGGGRRARPTSTWSSARTPTPPASCSPTRSSRLCERGGSAALARDGATERGGGSR